MMDDDDDNTLHIVPKTNTYRFQTFSQRISAINIDVIHKIRYKTAELEGRETFFSEALVRWSEINCTKDFTEFHTEVSRYGNTFNQLVHHESEVVSLIQSKLVSSDSLALEPLLDLVVQLARDLQTDLYKHFRQFFDILVTLLGKHAGNTDILEKIFVCLAYLFKFLWRYLVKDIKDVYSYFSPLLGADHKDYINNFAAESFAFLMRKTKDPSSLLDFMFQSLRDYQDRAPGVGRLLFEMVKGVQQQFHTVSIKVFPVILSKLSPMAPEKPSKTSLPWQRVEEAVTEMLRHMAEYSTAEHLYPLFAILLSNIHDCAGMAGTYELRRLHILLKLVHVWLKHKHGISVHKPQEVIDTNVTLLCGPVLPPDTVSTLLDNCAWLLLGRRITLDVSSSSKLIRAKLVLPIPCDSFTHDLFTCNVIFCTLMKSPQYYPVSPLSARYALCYGRIAMLCPLMSQLCQQILQSAYTDDQIFAFCRRLFDHSLFATHVLPALLTRCTTAVTSCTKTSAYATLRILSHIILHKAPIHAETLCHGQHPLYPLNLAAIPNGHRVVSHVCSHIASTRQIESDHVVWAATVCVPHLRPLTEMESMLTALVARLRKLLQSARKIKDLDLFLAYHVASSLILLESPDAVLRLVKPKLIQKLVKRLPDNTHNLKFVELVVSLAHAQDAKTYLTSEAFSTILPHVERNLSSPHTSLRVTTLRILSKFQLFTNSETNVFEMCLDIENTTISVQTYRERVRLVEKLAYEHLRDILPACVPMKIPLRYLISCFYVNFTELWSVVRPIIVSYAHNMAAAEFWDTFSREIHRAAEDIAAGDKRTTLTEPSITDLLSLYQSQFSLVTKCSDSPDLFSFRHQLWCTMAEFAEICERNSNDVIAYFNTFLHNEYYTLDMMNAPSQNIRSDEPGDVNADDNDEEDDETNESDYEDVDNNTTNRKSSFRGRAKKASTGKSIFKSLISHLDVFAKFAHPDKLSEDVELRQIYNRLLLHQNDGIQLAALNCVLSCKDESITPYRENLTKLIDEKTFKDELFELTKPETILEKHRPSVIPIVMRILYGKMFGRGAHNQAKRNTRRTHIFRFLMACSTPELRTFVDLIFEPCQSFFSDDIAQTTRQIRDSIDLTNVFPLIRIQGILDAVSLFLTKMGNHLTDYLPTVLQCILGYAAVCDGCLRQRDNVARNDTLRLKRIRINSITLVTQFLQDYPTYNYTEAELDAIFELLVWPALPNLPQNHRVPSPLLKLFDLFSQNNRYIPLLAKYHVADDGVELSPLTYTYKLLLADNVSDKVAQMILAMTTHLLDGPQQPNPPPGLVVTHSVLNRVNRRYAHLSVGTRLVVPHTDSILAYIQGVVKRLTSHPSKLQNHHRELDLLARVSEFVAEGSQCETLIKTLLPFMSRGPRRTEETERDLLTCILRLTKQCPHTQQFLVPMSRVLSWLEHRTSRNLVCDILEVIGDRVSQLKETTTLIKQLNSWNVKRVDEPDYDQRLNAFTLINKKIEESTGADSNFIIPIIHNNIYFMTFSEDFSLRDAATHCLSSILTRLAQWHVSRSVFNLIVCDNLILDVKAALRNKNEKVRDEFVTILATLVKNFPDELHVSHLTPLFDSDPDACFFINIRHIQVHKRTRALRRLEKFSAKFPLRHGIVTSYLIPLISPYLGPDYKKNSALQEAAVDALSAVCRRLPWTTYSQQLQHYLKLLPQKIDQQKLYIRAVVSILDAFTFDLSNSQYKTLPSAVKLAADGHEKADEYNPDEPDSELVIAEQNSADHGESNDHGDSNVVGLESTKTLDGNETTANSIVCTVAMATRIHKSIVERMLPQLYKCLTRKAKSDDEHKLAKKQYAEDTEILAIPIALAMVKLLQKLPSDTLDRRLSGILLKICHFLKSRSFDIRQSARMTLVKISKSLGSKYFPYILHEMKCALQRGYQLHVLSYTINLLLRDLATTLTPGDIDSSLSSVIQVCNLELFGKVSDEKEVDGIVSKLKEARVSRSYDTYEILAKYTGRASLMSLVSPVHKILEGAQSHRVASKIEEVLKKICYGLLANSCLDTQTIMVFVYGLIKDLPVANNNNSQSKPIKEEQPGQRPESCLLLPSQPKRGGEKPKVDKKTNIHLLVEFGFNVVNMLLKKVLSPTDPTHAGLCDPFLPILTDSLRSKYVKMITISLYCLRSMFHYPLPSLPLHINDIVNRLFILLKNYASSGAAKGDNAELITRCFQAVTVLVREVQCYKLDREKLLVLLTFCEEDIFDFNRQSTAFNLLKAILKRKLVIPEIDDLIQKVEQLSITSEAAHVQIQCRQVVLKYVLDYPLGKSITHHLEFYVSQLSYEFESGRQSALEMCATFFSQFPMKVLVQHAGLFFIPMSMVLINDDSSSCRKLATLALKALLTKVEHNCRNDLFSVTLSWIKNQKILVRTLATQLWGIFVEISPSEFTHRLPSVLPILLNLLDPDLYQTHKQDVGSEKNLDQCLFNVLSTAVVILQHCDLLTRPSVHSATIYSIYEVTRKCLSHNHTWVGYMASQAFGLLFASTDCDRLARAAVDPLPSPTEYLYTDTRDRLLGLCRDFCGQLESSLVDDAFADQIIKNLIFLMKVAKRISDLGGELPQEVDPVTEKVKPQFSVLWVVKKVVNAANYEVKAKMQSTIRRKNVFKWLAAVGLELGPTLLEAVLPNMLPPLLREINVKSSTLDVELKSLAQEVLDVLKSVVGAPTFTKLFSDAERFRVTRRQEQKLKRSIQMVADPEMATRLKLRKIQSKRTARKRKAEKAKEPKPDLRNRKKRKIDF